MARERFTLAPPPAPLTLDDARRVHADHRLNEIGPGFAHADRQHEALGIALAALDEKTKKESA